MADEPAAGPPGTAAASIRGTFEGRCPCCGAPGLFAGATRFADRCASCGLDYAQFNVGDGPAAFLTLILGTVIVALAIALELTVQPPFWVHMLLWLPLTVVAVVASLRLAKAWLLAAEYRNNAREGRRQ